MTANPMIDAPSRLPALLAAMVVFVIGLVVADRVQQVEIDRRTQVEHSFTLEQSAALRARIERELNATLYLMNGLSAYVAAHDDLLEDARVEGVLRALHRNSEHLHHVGLAPGNVLRYLYPLAGNEAAVGLRYEDNPQQWPAIERAMRERRTIMVGPIDLVQGGRGLVVRTPVHLEDNRYWGVMTLVIDSLSLFDAAGLVESGDAEFTRHALRWSPTSHPGDEVIRGDPAVFDDAQVLQTIEVPGGAWQLASRAIAPIDPAGSALLRASGIVVALLLALLVFLLVDRRVRSAWQSQHDPLTRLPNRRLFRARAERALRRGEAADTRVAVAYIDLNGYKAVNDTHGHSVGDRVLAGVGQRLAEGAEAGELIARLGGDEFAVLIEQVESDEAIRRRIEMLVDAVGPATAELAPDCPLGAAAGVAFYPEDGHRIDALLAVADQRMFVDKRQQADDAEHGEPSTT